MRKKRIYRKHHAHFLFSDFKNQYISNLSYLLSLHCQTGSSLQIIERLLATSEISTSYRLYIWFFYNLGPFSHLLFALWLYFMLLKSWCNGMGCMCVKSTTKVVSLWHKDFQNLQLMKDFVQNYNWIFYPFLWEQRKLRTNMMDHTRH